MPRRSYEPSVGDLRYRNAVINHPDLDPFEEAVLLREISDEYLSVLAHDNTGDKCAGFAAMITTEQNRRSRTIAHRANRIALVALAVSIGSLMIALF